MFELVSWIFGNQGLFILLGLSAGVIVTIFILIFYSSQKVWRIVDLFWVTAGGVAAFFAILASVFLTNQGELNRNIDIAQSELKAFHSSVGLFLARNCTGYEFDIPIAIASENRQLVCTRVELLSEETSEENSLARFVNAFSPSKDARVSDADGVDEKFGDIFAELEAEVPEWGNLDWRSPSDVAATKIGLDGAGFFGIELGGQAVVAANELVSIGVFSNLGHEYLVLEDDYDAIKERFSQLHIAWNDNERYRSYLLIRLVSLFVVALVFPLRIGKSIFEIRKS